MNLLLERDIYTARSVEGLMYVDGQYECSTLERPWLDNQPEISCIPEGTYEVIKTWSGHFNRWMPELSAVPNRSDIRIHPANWPSQLHGCIAVGTVRGLDFVANSQQAFNALFLLLSDAWEKAESVSLTIRKKA